MQRLAQAVSENGAARSQRMRDVDKIGFASRGEFRTAAYGALNDAGHLVPRLTPESAAIQQLLHSGRRIQRQNRANNSQISCALSRRKYRVHQQAGEDRGRALARTDSGRR